MKSYLELQDLYALCNVGRRGRIDTGGNRAHPFFCPRQASGGQILDGRGDPLELGTQQRAVWQLLRTIPYGETRNTRTWRRP